MLDIFEREKRKVAQNHYWGAVFPFQTTACAAALNFPPEDKIERAASPFSNPLTDLHLQIANDIMLENSTISLR